MTLEQLARPKEGKVGWLSISIIGILFFIFFGPVLRWLAHVWLTSVYDAHGGLVPLIFAVMLIAKRHELTTLKIKPILTFGVEIAPVGRVRTHSRAIERMVDYLRELKARGASDWIVQHAQGAADAEHLVEAGRELFGTEPTFCTEVGPVLGAHLGAGVLVGGMTRQA